MDYKNLRFNLEENQLDKNSISCPFNFLDTWLQDAIDKKIKHPNAMVLSTLSEDGFPNSRVVLLKEILDKKIIFYTNYKSRKGEDILATPKISLNFFWRELSRQVRISGEVEKVSREKSAKYFNSRPFKSQVAAAISRQSQEVESREVLNQEFEELLEHSQEVTCPEHWGGYALNPLIFEFWAGRSNRMHDRIELQKAGESWSKRRLYP